MKTRYFALCVLLFPLSYAILSCSDHSHVTDPDQRSDIADWYKADGGSSSEAQSSSSSVAQSSSSSAGTSSVSSSSSAEASSSSSRVLNNQTCAYTPGRPQGTLACQEKSYNTVTIGSVSDSLTLMAENLDIGTRVSGIGADAKQSNDTLIEKYYYNDIDADSVYGGLYQWAEAMGLPSVCDSTSCDGQISAGNHQGICPMGWHIPKAAEWDSLANMLGGNLGAGKAMKLNAPDFIDWNAATYNDGNSSGFSALPAGGHIGDGFFNRGRHAYFWGASEFQMSSASCRYLNYDGTLLGAQDYNKTNGFSVRCFKD